MEANELMIDDYIYVKRGYDGHLTLERVKGILKEEKEAYPIRITTGETVSLEDIVPIPLTPEILEKNGFIRDMFYGEWQFDLDPFPFSVVQRKNNSWYLGREEHGIAHNREIIDISYVHELQHALRLCGIEKEMYNIDDLVKL